MLSMVYMHGVPLEIAPGISCYETILLVCVCILNSCICYLLLCTVSTTPRRPQVRISLDVRVSYLMLLLTGIP